jgi:peptidoglycan/LPS O-acetylase OafA/YrhL
VFIVVSGFSLALAPLDNGGKLKGGVSRFLRRRAWRILPAYWAALVLSVFVTVVFLQPQLGPAAVGKSVAVYGLLVQDAVGSATPNGAFWSIAVEWQIYFLFPLILWLALRTRLSTAVLVTAAVVLAAHAVAGTGAPFDKMDHLTPQFLVLFALGVLAVQLGREGWTAGRRGLLYAVTSAAFTGFVALAITEGTAWIVAHFFWMDLLFGLGFAGVLTLLHSGAARSVQRVLASRTALWLGLFSYSIYLVHDPIVGLLSKGVVGPLHLAPLAAFAVTLAIGLPIVIALCYGFHLLFEAPFLHNRGWSAVRTSPILRLLPGAGARPVAAVGRAVTPAARQPAAGEHPAG